MDYKPWSNFSVFRDIVSSIWVFKKYHFDNNNSNKAKYIRVSRIPFRMSSRHAFVINRLFKHHLMQFKKKIWKFIVKKQCKRAKTIFQPAQGSKWACLADHFQDFTLPKWQMPSNSHMFFDYKLPNFFENGITWSLNTLFLARADRWRPKS